MSDVKFVLETASSAFGPGDIPWHKAHRETFPTLVEAQAAYDADLEEMVERCGPGMAWDSHRRIVPAEDTAVTYDLLCSGAGNLLCSGDNGKPCPDWKVTRITIAWQAGEPRPFPEPPTDWHTTYQCVACAEREVQMMNRLREEYDREERKREERKRDQS